MELPSLLAVMVMVMVMITTGRGENSTLQRRQKLRETLLFNYNKDVLPRLDQEPLILTMTSFNIRDLSMNEETHRLQLHAWVGFEWVDNRLSWDNYDIQKLTFPPQDLWLPDMTFYTAAEAEDAPLVPKTLLVVEPNGKVFFVSPFDLPFSCVADLTYWPHDTHQCNLKLGSWVHDGYTIDLRVEDSLTTEVTREVTLSPDGNMDTLDWEIKSGLVKREETFYECCPEPYINLQVIFKLHRKAPVYNWVVKAPAACLVLLTLVVFVLPPGAGEKITFGGICLLLNLLFLVFTHGTVRNAPSHTPLLVELVVVQMVVTAASVLIASWVVRAAQGPYFAPPSSPLHRLSLSMASALGLSAYVPQVPGKEHQGRGMARNEMEMDSQVESSLGSEQSGIAAQWILLGAVLDRFALGLYLIVSLVMLVRFLNVI